MEFILGYLAGYGVKTIYNYLMSNDHELTDWLMDKITAKMQQTKKAELYICLFGRNWMEHIK